jgi:hypothetical protein
VGEGAIRFSHSGYRYLLGYGPDYFGIWDRQSPGGPVHRFPRTDEGWAEAWSRFTAMEPRAYEVGVGAGPASGAALGPFRPAGTRAAWTVALVLLVAGMALVFLGANARYLGLAYRARAGLAVSLEDVRASEDLVGVAFGLLYLSILPAGLAWFLWQHRAHANLRALGAEGLKYSPGWAVGWWFVPLANVVMPFVTMRELWKASDPGAAGVSWKLLPTPRLLVMWWGAYLVGVQGLPSIAGNVTDAALPSPQQVVVRSWLFIAAAVVTVAAAGLAVAVVRGVQARQETKRAAVAAWAEAAPAPGG